MTNREMALAELERLSAERKLTLRVVPDAEFAFLFDRSKRNAEGKEACCAVKIAEEWLLPEAVAEVTTLRFEHAAASIAELKEREKG